MVDEAGTARKGLLLFDGNSRQLHPVAHSQEEDFLPNGFEILYHSSLKECGECGELSIEYLSSKSFSTFDYHYPGKRCTGFNRHLYLHDFVGIEEHLTDKGQCFTNNIIVRSSQQRQNLGHHIQGNHRVLDVLDT